MMMRCSIGSNILKDQPLNAVGGNVQSILLDGGIKQAVANVAGS